MQPSLLDWVPSSILGDRDGQTFDRNRDGKPLNQQAHDVFNLMRDGEWRPLFRISQITGHPEASISARLRDLRKSRFGGYTVERKRVGGGCDGERLWLYRVLV
jgi:hypothetical protein